MNKTFMADIFTPEEKKTLRLAARVARSIGKNDIHMDFQDYDAYEYQQSFDNIDPAEVRLTIDSSLIELGNIKDLGNIFYKFYRYVENNVKLPYTDIEYFRNQYFEMIFSPKDQTLSFTYTYSYTDEATQQVTSFEGDEAEEVLSPLDNMDVDELRLDYQGGGDEGSLDWRFDNGETVPDDVESWCYMKLSENHGGWEIDEGSHGYFWFDLEKREVQMAYTDYYEEYREKVLLKESFAN